MSLVKKYRPKTFDEIVGHDIIKKQIKNIIDRPEIPDMLFIGPPGVGKTVMAEVIARTVFGDSWRTHFLEFNSSDDRGIDFVRNKLAEIPKMIMKTIVLLDEFDGMTSAAQDALRRIIEQSKNATFILTANRPEKIIPAIKSRCVQFRFNPLSNEEIVKILVSISKKEGMDIETIKQNKENFLTIARECRGDLRTAINMLERLIANPEQGIFGDYQSDKLVEQCLTVVANGNLPDGISILEDIIIKYKFAPEFIAEAFYKYAKNIKNYEILLALLKDAEYRCRIGGNPLIQFAGMLAEWFVINNRGGQIGQ